MPTRSFGGMVGFRICCFNPGEPMSDTNCLLQFVTSFRALDAGIRIDRIGQSQLSIQLDTRIVRLVWLVSCDMFVEEFWSAQVLSAKLTTTDPTVALHTAIAWLQSKCTLSGLRDYSKDLIPTEEGIALERNELLDLRWSRLAETAPPRMKAFTLCASSDRRLRETYPLFRLNRLALMRTDKMASDFVSVRPINDEHYEVMDSNGNSLGIGDMTWAITTLSLAASKFETFRDS